MADTAEAGLDLLERKSWLRPDEAAAILRFSRRTIYRMYERGDLEGAKLKGTVRIKSESIKALLQGEI